MAAPRHASKHKAKPTLKRVEVYPSQDTAMRLRDRLAAERVGIDFVVQKVPNGYIVRELQMTSTEVRVKAPGPTFKTHAERSEYLYALQDELDYQRALREVVHQGRSKEPKSIHAEVPVRSISKPKLGSKKKEHEDSSHVRTGITRGPYGSYPGRWKSDHAGWRKLPRTD